MTMPVSVAQATRIRLRRAWAADWDRVNPILGDGEPGFDRTNNMLKIGDGVSPWRQLSYLTPPPGSTVSTPSATPATGSVTSDAALTSHVNSATPHSVYDNGPSLYLLYQNAKV